MIRKTALAALAAACLAAPVAANDTTASMGAGGLVLQRTDGIVMRSEDLFVSAAEIRVRYAFFNRTDRDISTIVAFPLPDIVGGHEGDVALSDPGDLEFSTTVDGRRVATEVEQKALKDGADHTALLRGLGVPLSPYDDAVRDTLAALARDRIERLIELGLVEDRGYADSTGTTVDLAPLWTLKTTHYWTQVFPAGEVLAVDHRYVPAIGGTAGSAFGDPDLALTRWGTLKISYRSMMTSLEGVFAAGDIVRGASLVVWAIRDGRDAAESIHADLMAKAAGAQDDEPALAAVS